LFISAELAASGAYDIVSHFLLGLSQRDKQRAKYRLFRNKVEVLQRYRWISGGWRICKFSHSTR